MPYKSNQPGQAVPEVQLGIACNKSPASRAFGAIRFGASNLSSRRKRSRLQERRFLSLASVANGSMPRHRRAKVHRPLETARQNTNDAPATQARRSSIRRGPLFATPQLSHVRVGQNAKSLVVVDEALHQIFRSRRSSERAHPTAREPSLATRGHNPLPVPQNAHLAARSAARSAGSRVRASP